MTKKKTKKATTTKEERKAMADALRDDEGFERRPIGEPDRVRAAVLEPRRGRR